MLDLTLMVLVCFDLKFRIEDVQPRYYISPKFL
jgi:hypothetical protein